MLLKVHAGVAQQGAREAARQRGHIVQQPDQVAHGVVAARMPLL